MVSEEPRALFSGVAKWRCPAVALKSGKATSSEIEKAVNELACLKPLWEATLKNFYAKEEDDVIEASVASKAELKGTGEASEGTVVQGTRDLAVRAMMQRRAWELALSPAKGLGMNIFMIFMSGSGGGIFSLLVLGYALMSAVQMLTGVGKAFAGFEGPNAKQSGSVILQKLVYSATSLAAVMYILYQCSQMGLLPVHEGDFVGSKISRPSSQAFVVIE